MKIILSRKGFDSANGGCPSPILPDGTLLSIPIPSDDNCKYSDLKYKDIVYSNLLMQLNPTANYKYCHLDPDIREDCRINTVKKWKPSFGQIGSAQSLLSNAGVEKGDIFLFFGWFRRVELCNGKYRYVPKNNGDFYNHSDLNIIYGYLQIGDILTDEKDIAQYIWHPHCSETRIHKKSNAIYIPTEHLSLNTKKPGFGTLTYRQDRVLTEKNCSRAKWVPHEFLMPEHVYGNRKNSSATDNCLYYRGVWQELIVFESEKLFDWVKSIIN